MTTVQELYDAIEEWQVKKARLIAIGETYRAQFTRVITELVRDEEAHKVMGRAK